LYFPSGLNIKLYLLLGGVVCWWCLFLVFCGGFSLFCLLSFWNPCFENLFISEFGVTVFSVRSLDRRDLQALSTKQHKSE